MCATTLYRHTAIATLRIHPLTTVPGSAAAPGAVMGPGVRAAGVPGLVSPEVVACSAAVRFGDTSPADVHNDAAGAPDAPQGEYRDYCRVSPVWLDAVISRLESEYELLERLQVVGNDTAPSLDTVSSLLLTGEPVTVRAVHARETRFGDDAGETRALLARLVRDGYLLTQLRAPGTIVDQLGYLVDQLDQVRADEVPSVSALVAGLREVHTGLRRHAPRRWSGDTAADGHRAVRALTDRARDLARDPADTRRVVSDGPAHTPDRLSGHEAERGRPVTVHRRLTAPVQLPATLLADAELAATALYQLGRRPADPVWADYHRRFRDRFGVGLLVPVTRLLDPAVGLGYPVGYPDSPFPIPATADEAHQQDTHRRDAALLALAMNSQGEGPGEIVLDATTSATGSGTGLDAGLDAVFGAITTRDRADRAAAPAHLDLAVTVHAPTLDALNDGSYLVQIRGTAPAGTWTAGCALDALDNDIAAATHQGVDEYTEHVELLADPLTRTLRDAPPDTLDATRVQLTYPLNTAPHGGVVPTCLPTVTWLGAYPAWSVPGQVEAEQINIAFVGVVATDDRLHVTTLDGEVLDPQLFGDRNAAPPLARFLADLPRGSAPPVTLFEWGPVADRLPYLPRVRCGRVVLSPARWRITRHDLHTSPGNIDGPGTSVAEALARFRQRWACPAIIDLALGSATEPLTEPLTEPPVESGVGFVAAPSRVADSVVSERGSTLRLTLTDADDVHVLVHHIATHGEAIITETLDTLSAHRGADSQHTADAEHTGITESSAVAGASPGAGIGWLGGTHDVVLPLVRRAAPAPSPELRDAPATRPPHDGQLPGCPDALSWTQVKIFTSAATMTTLITEHLPVLTVNGEQARVWYDRHPATSLDPAHLRIHVQPPDPVAEHNAEDMDDDLNEKPDGVSDGETDEVADGGDVVAGDVLADIARWTAGLVRAGLTARVEYSTYFPETGVYGEYSTREYAESVHVADSALSTTLLTEWSRVTPPPEAEWAVRAERTAVAAASLVHIARAFLYYDDLAYDWLTPPDATPGQTPRIPAGAPVRRPASPPGSRRASPLAPEVLARTITLATADLHAPDPWLSSTVRQCWADRARALAKYRTQIPRGLRDQALTGLLNAHANRLHPDPGDAHACLDLAGQAARHVMRGSVAPS